MTERPKHGRYLEAIELALELELITGLLGRKSCACAGHASIAG